ncbi:hypothetical protein [Neorhizobium galegae]|uniref:Uncharacterized protein n=2 Tax=Neorhizobium galegae TaxID=399 RepID=A0A068SW87_NEOGA|nr:hypothetical protein [Neorhizobium galegae]KAB1089164.1 hypothetical protein F4V91_24155 [Neorhizobium galegae]MCQ1855088.1 hypothetical protein [Neorhizobium galegae]CDN50562.1 Hypothetical protein RG540_CH44210 [Neorhizobium galegae bv. orientalis str. HAMBI 540]CDZ48630.1 Hypothetical protein NGAL_HAMBI2427_27370 [Neorhizobium galegae bv. orientalis]
MAATKDEFFNPTKLSARDKAAATDHTARSIISAEATQREKKTEKLRQLRLEREAAEPVPAPVRAKGRKASADH